MANLTKRMRAIRSEIDFTKQYSVIKALELLKELATAKFIESVDAAIKLGINVQKSDQSVQGSAILPHGTGRNVRVAVFAQGESLLAAESAGADLVGMEELAEQIKEGQLNFDLVIASPDAMHLVGQLGKILGPRKLMPNPKVGTITTNMAEAVKNAKSGQVFYRSDKHGIVHTIIGKASFSSDQLKQNLESLLISLKRVKPAQSKGVYIKQINLSTTMGIGVIINQNSLFV